jgi:hypothetical protein
VDGVQNLIFKILLPQMIKKQSNLSLNGQIHIQTIKFEFKQTNQDATPHYRLPAPAAGRSAGGTAWVLSPGPAWR